MKIISISGLDGSGKSTQIELLQKYLESQGKKVMYFHAVQFSFGQTIKRFYSKKQKVATEKGIGKANWLQIQLRKLALCIDLMRFKSYLKKLEKQGYDYLVSDRYFYDNIININYLSHQSYTSSISSIPRPDHAFYLKTDPEQIMQRDRVPEQGLEYLETKKKLFDKFAPIFDLKIIDGNQTKEEIFEKIKKEVTL